MQDETSDKKKGYYLSAFSNARQSSTPYARAALLALVFGRSVVGGSLIDNHVSHR
jgi:hypothetical protein